MIRFLYLGRQRTLPQEIEAIWQNVSGTEAGAHTLQIHPATNQTQATDALRATAFHAILLEINSQSQQRTHFCHSLRRRYPELYIVAVSTHPPDQALFAFDRFLNLPLCPTEVEETLRALHGAEDETHLHSGAIHLDIATRTVEGPRGSHRLPPKQCNLLRTLIAHADEVVSRETIMRLVWETDYLADTRTLDVHMRWLREKIEPDPDHPVHLMTVRGRGYQLVTH